MRLMISIPVHERPEVVRDQVENVLRFNPSSFVVLHVSREFPKPFLSLKPLFEESERVLVNPERFSSSKQGLVKIHLSSYNYARKQREFDGFVIQASNDLYVRAGAEAYAGRFDAIMRPVPLPNDSTWHHAKPAMTDPIFKLIPNLGVHASTAEGTCYPVALMDKMAGLLSGYAGPATPYPDEETVLPTLAMSLTQKHGLPWVYSEVTMERPLDEDTIDQVRAGTLSPAYKTFYSDPQDRLLYNPEGLFAVKRVPRVLDHPLRVHIRNIPHG